MSNPRITGKVVVVTRAGNGLGEALAILFRPTRRELWRISLNPTP